jgi:hypothetical protein
MYLFAHAIDKNWQSPFLKAFVRIVDDGALSVSTSDNRSYRREFMRRAARPRRSSSRFRASLRQQRSGSLEYLVINEFAAVVAITR